VAGSFGTLGGRFNMVTHMDKQEPERSKESWGFPQEREFIENLLCQRFNFFLVFFGLVVAGAIACKEQLYLQILLWFGASIAFLISLTIAGLQWKLGVILDKIYLDRDSPIGFFYHNVCKLHISCIIGYLIPGICTLSLLFGAICASMNIWKV
jgi:hypothetical protein